MRKIVILSIGHGGQLIEGRTFDPGAVAPNGMTENEQVRNIVQPLTLNLVKRGMTVLVVGDWSLPETMNQIDRLTDALSDKFRIVAVELHKDSVKNYDPQTMHRRCGVYYARNVKAAQQEAEKMRDAMIEAGGHKTSWARKDNDRGHGLAFCVQLACRSFIFELGFMEGLLTDDENVLYAEIADKALQAIGF